MRECRKRHPKVSSPLLPQQLCKTALPWKKRQGKVIPRNKQLTIGSDGRPLFDPKGLYFPTDSHQTDERAKKVLADLQRDQKSRFQNQSLLLDNLRELGMYGDLSEDKCHVNMPFKDVHRLVMTMKMAELILNDRVQLARKEKNARIKAKLDADCPNMSTWLLELDKAKRALTQRHSFRSIGAFDADAYDLEGLILYETVLLTRAVDWLARLSIDSRAEIRRGTITAVFSELQSAYTTQRTLHELYFHHHGDKKLLEARVRGAMSEMGKRLTKVAVTPTGSVIQKRQNIAVQL
jgi:hypothetical protein